MKVVQRLVLGPLWLLLISAALISAWFREGLLFAGGEGGIPFYNPTKYLTLISHTWYDAGTGFPVIGFIPGIPYFTIVEYIYKLGVSAVTLQALTFLILIVVGTLSVFYLIKETIGRELGERKNVIVSLVSSIFYLLNPFSMTQIWGRGNYPQFFAFTLVPLFLLLFILGIRKKNPAFGIAALLVSFIFSPIFFSPTQTLVLFAPVFVYLIYYLLTTKSRAEYAYALGFSVLFLLFWLAANSWWIIPYYKTGVEVYSQSLSGTEANVGSLIGVSRQYPLPSLIRLMHDGYFYEARYYGDSYSSPLFIAVSWLIPVVSLVSVTVFRKLAHFKFYALLFFLGLFVSLGANAPLGWLFTFLFKNIPILQAFRNPYEKFGIVYLLAYTPFFALGTVIVANRVSLHLKNLWRNKLSSSHMTIAVLVVLISGIFVWPMWMGRFAGGYKINPWVEVPDYYRTADDWLRERGGDFRILQAPLIPGEGIRYTWENSYQGAEPSEYLFAASSIGRNTGRNKIYYNILLERFDSFQANVFGPDPDTSNSAFRSKELYQELEKLAVRYIVLHRDLDESIAGSKSPEETAVFLEKQPRIKKVKTFGELDVYEVDISDRAARIYSPDVQTEFIRYSPTHYEVDIKDSKGEVELYFLDLFDTGWEAFVGGEKVSEYYRVFDYANAWKINKKGDYKVTIKYKPQEYVYAGMKISGVTIILLVLMGIYSWRKRRL